MKRYPGATYFTEAQKDIFFGREDDIAALLKMIQFERKILLYSKSGAGKTSLLKAGIIPRLDANLFETISIRFFAYTEKSISTIERFLSYIFAIKEFQDLDKHQTILDLYIPRYKNNLWYIFKKYELVYGNKKDILLIFDQFEELFYYPAEQITEFKDQLTQILYSDKNIFIRELEKKVYTEKENLPDFKNLVDLESEQLKIIYEPIKVKSIFIIRNDQLSFLNQLSDKVPDIQKTFYELKPLTYGQIKEAIEKPAITANPGFETEAFEFLPETVEKIINELSENHTQPVETTQLQIVCQQIEEIAQQKHVKTLHATSLVKIELHDLPKFDAIFYNFYDNAVKKLPETEQNHAQRLIEDNLVRNNRRISLDENICAEFLEASHLQTLVNTHLLRAERNSVGGFSYELAHDTLVPPITESRKKRIEKEEEERAEKERLEELRLAKEKAEKERVEREKERKQQRRIITIVSIAAIVSIAFGIFGFVYMRIAQNERDKTKNLTIMGNMRDAQAYMDKEEFEDAIEKYVYLRDTILDRKNPEPYDKKIAECRQLDSLKKIFDQNISTIDSMLKVNEITMDVFTILQNTENLKYKPGDEKLKIRKQSVSNKKADLVLTWKNQASTFIDARFYDNARKLLNDAKKLDPDDSEIDVLLRKIP